jgi:cytidine deaminase
MTDQLTKLIEQAIDVTRMAYVPYSNYRVGAALLASDGTVFTGCNVENAAYPSTICAERTALVKAISEGRRSFEIVVVATENGGSPCGTCRQMLFEFSPTMRVVCINMSGEITIDEPLDKMLLHGFGPEKLPIKPRTGE